VFHHYRALIAMRHTEPVLVDGDFTLLAPDHPWLWAFTRRNASVELLVVANLSAERVDAEELVEAGVDLTAWTAAETLLPTHPDDRGSRAGLSPWESRIHRRST
jgi:oligo-1,6-glucosidase